MGKALGSEGGSFFRSTDENAMGELQSSDRQHSIEYRLSQKTGSMPRVHRGPRNDAFARANSQRTFHCPHGSLYASMARSPAVAKQIAGQA